MDLLDETLNALDIKINPTFEMVAKNMPPSPTISVTNIGDETDGSTK